MPVRTNGAFAAGPPRPLFELRRLAANLRTLPPCDASPDGQRFLIGAVVDEGGDESMTVVLGWRRLLRDF